MFNEHEQAYILHTRAFKDSSLLLEIFSLTYGRLTLLAKGARREKSPWRAILRPFLPLLLIWRGRRDLKTLVSAENTQAAPNLQKGALVAGLYTNEILIRLIQEKELPFANLYRYYDQLLAKLHTEPDIELSLRWFELQLMRALGFELPLTKTAYTGEPILPADFYYFDPENGAIPYLSVMENKKYVFSGESLLALAKFELTTAKQRKDAKHLMRLVLNHHLGHKPLKSRELWLAYK